MSAERNFTPKTAVIGHGQTQEGEVNPEMTGLFTFNDEADIVRDGMLAGRIRYGTSEAEILEATSFDFAANDNSKYRLVTEVPAGSLVGIQNRASRLALIATKGGSCVQINELRKIMPDGETGGVIKGAGRVAAELKLQKNDVRAIAILDPNPQMPILEIPMSQTDNY